MKVHTIKFTNDDLIVRITRYPAEELAKEPSVEIEVESSALPRSLVWLDRESQVPVFKEEYIEMFHLTTEGENHE